jgi:hypothetical protein
MPGSAAVHILMLHTLFKTSVVDNGDWQFVQ